MIMGRRANPLTLSALPGAIQSASFRWATVPDSKRATCEAVRVHHWARSNGLDGAPLDLTRIAGHRDYAA